MLLGMGAAVGFISGLFGVGGGFLLTPLLIFTGIPPAVAVATVTSQTVASSTSGALSYWRRQAIDLKLASMLISGGIVGSSLGVFVFRLLRDIGQLDLIISVSYLTFLSSIGILMLRESIRAMLKNRDGKPPPARMPGQHSWVLGLPLKMKFRRSKLYVSVLPVLGLGISIGFMGSVLGIGGGFIMVPALIYLLRVPTAMVIGTSLICGCTAIPGSRRRFRCSIRSAAGPEAARRTSSCAAGSAGAGSRYALCCQSGSETG